MKTALVCIAKNEEDYLDEWVNYHLKLGFDDIHIYQNNWRWENPHPSAKMHVSDGYGVQTKTYNQFANHAYKLYDWAAFFDVDEFLVLKKHKNVKEFIREYEFFPAISIHWVFFGDNGHKTIDSDRSVLKRFTKRSKVSKGHFKTIVKLNVHTRMEIHNHEGFSVNTNCSLIDQLDFAGDRPIDIAQLNHYHVKTIEEYKLKIARGRASREKNAPDYFKPITEFDKHNFNEVEDLLAYNFLYGTK